MNISQIVCGLEEDHLKICCPVLAPPEILVENKPDTIVDIFANCGYILWEKKLTPDGSPTDLYEFPWLAILEYNTGG